MYKAFTQNIGVYLTCFIDDVQRVTGENGLAVRELYRLWKFNEMSENARERKMCPSERQKFVEHDIKYVRRRNILSDEEAFMSYWIAICLKRFLRNIFELFLYFSPLAAHNFVWLSYRDCLWRMKLFISLKSWSVRCYHYDEISQVSIYLLRLIRRILDVF